MKQFVDMDLNKQEVHLNTKGWSKKALMINLKLGGLIRNYETIAVDAYNVFSHYMDEKFDIGKGKNNKKTMYEILRYKYHDWNRKQHEFRKQTYKHFNRVINSFFEEIFPILQSRIKFCVVFDGRRAVAKKNKYKKTEKQEQQEIQFDQYYEHHCMVMRFIMINNLKAAGVRVMVAPYEADHQIVRLFRQNRIKSVYSKDCGFFFYGVPYIPKIDHPQTPKADVVDRKLIEDNQKNIVVDEVRNYIKSTKNMSPGKLRDRNAVFGILAGNGNVLGFQEIPLIQTMNIVWRQKIDHSTQSFLSDFFRYAEEKTKKQTAKQYIQECQNALKVWNYGKVWSEKHQRLEYLDDEEGEMMLKTQKDRQMVGENYQNFKFTQEHFDGERDVKTGQKNTVGQKVYGYFKDRAKKLIQIKQWMSIDHFKGKEHIYVKDTSNIPHNPQKMASIRAPQPGIKKQVRKFDTFGMEKSSSFHGFKPYSNKSFTDYPPQKIKSTQKNYHEGFYVPQSNFGNFDSHDMDEFPNFSQFSHYGFKPEAKKPFRKKNNGGFGNW